MQTEDKNKFTYTIVEESENPGDNVIEKSGMSVKFTLNDIERNLNELTKKLKELKAKLEYEEARAKNVEENHPFVLELGDEKGQIVHLYQEARAYVRQIPQFLKEIEENIADLQAERAHIQEVCGVAIPRIVLDPAPAPAEEVEKAEGSDA